MTFALIIFDEYEFNCICLVLLFFGINILLLLEIIDDELLFIELSLGIACFIIEFLLFYNLHQVKFELYLLKNHQ